MMSHAHLPNAYSIPVRVYYEDTDAGGVVYYANYLKYLERCRSDWMRQTGFGQSEIASHSGIAFVVRSLQLEYLKPARLDDLLDIGLAVEKLGRAQILFRQHIRRGDDLLLTGTVQIVCIKADAQPPAPIAIPDHLRTQLEALQ